MRLSGQGLLLGEGALVARCPRAANVVACCNSRLLCWKADQLQGLHGIDHTVAQVTVVSHALEQLPFFCNLPVAQLKALSTIMAVDSFPGSSVIFHEGELDDQLFSRGRRQCLCRRAAFAVGRRPTRRVAHQSPRGGGRRVGCR